MRVFTYLLGLMALCGAAFAAPVALIDTDFGTVPLHPAGTDERNERATGEMAEKWKDNSVWAPVWVEYGRAEEEGRRYLKVKVTRIDSGRCQIQHTLPEITAESFFRLSMTARGTSNLPVQIGIRQTGTPYKYLWESTPRLSAEWRDYHYDFRLTAHDQPVSFYIGISSTAEVNLASLRLVQLNRAEYIEELRSKYAGGKPRNMVRVSRFPLGLQSGWSLSRDNSDGDDVQIGPDPAMVGHSGAPALRVATKEPVTLHSAPFAVPMAFEKHTASLYLRGTGKVAMSVLCDGKQLARQSVDLKEGDWQRLVVAFDPVLMGQCYALRVEGSESFWMDALQVAPGATAIEYAPQLACEVSLAVPPSAASTALVQFENEPATVRYCVSGEAPGAVLRAKVVSPYGEEKPLPAVTLRPGFLNQGTLQYGLFPQRPYGPFRIEAWVEDRAGKALSPANEIVLYRLRQPRYWGKDAPDSPFGVHTQSATRHLVMAKAVGANWTRLHDAGLQYIGWYHVEPKQGEWKFYDKEIYRYRRHQIKILGELGTAPFWASYFPGKAHNGYFDRFYQPRRMEDYAHYVRTVTQRYKGVIDAWDVWNEPWIHAWWGVGYDETKGDRAGYLTSKEPQRDFVRLMRTAYETAKAVDPKVTILGVNSTTGGGGTQSFSGEEWTRGVVQAGGMDTLDVVCYHHYMSGKSGYPGDAVEQGFRTATGPIQEKFGKQPKPVWMSEGSAGRDVIGHGLYHHTVPFANHENVFETSDRLCRYVVSLLGQGVSKVFLYSMHAQSHIGMPQSWRVLVTDEGALHPTGAAHSAMAWHLEDTRFVKTVPLAEGVIAYLFQGKGRAVAVLCGKGGHAQYALPTHAQVALTDLFGNPLPKGQVLGDHMVYASAGMTADALARILTGGVR